MATAFALAPSAFMPGMAPVPGCASPARRTGGSRVPRAALPYYTPPAALLAAMDLRNFLPQPRAQPPAVIAPAPRTQSSSFVTEAVRAVGPAVVRIDTERSVVGVPDVPPGLEGLFDDPALKKFFADEFGSRVSPPRKRLERGLGSGFIISTDGIVVTNAHVVKGADKLTVTLTDGRTFEGRVSGTDELLDLAVVKIDPAKPTGGLHGASLDGSLEPADGPLAGGGLNFGLGQKAKTELPVAKLGSSANISVGDWCIAVGNPHGLNNTVTLGIVSSLNRSAAEVGIPEKRLSLIQTSAPLNAGNSGGVIANEFGEVIGVATAVRANAEGIGFAIPIDRVKDIVHELANGKTIAHPFLGIRMLTLTPDYARENNSNPNAPAVIPEVNGAIVVHVIPESPAAKSPGLRRFDIIVGIDGKKCRGVKDVQSIVEGAGVGQRINIQVLRGGEKAKPIDVVVETGDLSKASRADGPLATPIPLPLPRTDPRL